MQPPERSEELPQAIELSSSNPSFFELDEFASSRDHSGVQLKYTPIVEAS
jgi:hypothetical protein